ncbi:NUDIX hydrolase [Vibrio neptunius]|uniref:NUDIX hydrolase n=1 Tax=Vibrio neptunius TaxID=170651 RepID=UPI0019D0D6AB|nr:NUDIX hydrolase [Vibrio neptunius]MBN3572161.1 NUDIX hydrolase [Vibrio neptunius]QXX08626.1 NUDIX hydrolase [Vibrio neptunius]
MKHLAMAVVIRDGKVLIQERYRPAQGMIMEFPGGEVDSNESGTNAAIRELYEETHLSGLSHVATYSDINEYGGRIYYVVLHAGQSTLPVAHSEHRQQTFHWMTADEIPTTDFYKADVNFIQQHLNKHICRELKELA